MRVEGDLIWVHVEAVPIAHVLAEIAVAGGVRVQGAESLTRPVSLHRSGVPIGAAVADLLRGTSFALEYEADRLAAVYVGDITGRPQPPEPTGPPEATAAADAAWERRVLDVLQARSSPSGAILLERTRRRTGSMEPFVRALEWLPALGEDGQRLLQEALQLKDPAIRARAAELLRGARAHQER